jgi:hypothetical protein
MEEKRPPHNLKNDKIQRYACNLHIDYGAAFFKDICRPEGKK